MWRFISTYLATNREQCWRLGEATALHCIACTVDYLQRRLDYDEDDGAVRRVEWAISDRDIIGPFSTGRYSYLFSVTVAGANASTIVYSLMLTCRACNVEPYAYLVQVATELP